jgi:Mn2+/Fe2+ NRAMP family transporter
MSGSLLYRCYIIPLVAALLAYLLMLPQVTLLFQAWVPNLYYRNLVKVLLLLVVLFILCRTVDICCAPPPNNQQAEQPEDEA